MMTFLEFYLTLLRFTHFKLYHMLGQRYPPVLDERLDAVAAGLVAVMHQLAEPGAEPPAAGARLAPLCAFWFLCSSGPC